MEAFGLLIHKVARFSVCAAVEFSKIRDRWESEFVMERMLVMIDDVLAKAKVVIDLHDAVAPMVVEGLCACYGLTCRSTDL